MGPGGGSFLPGGPGQAREEEAAEEKATGQVSDCLTPSVLSENQPISGHEGPPALPQKERPEQKAARTHIAGKRQVEAPDNLGRFWSTLEREEEGTLNQTPDSPGTEAHLPSRPCHQLPSNKCLLSTYHVPGPSGC